MAEDLEEQIGAVFVDGQISEFVDDEQARLEVLAQFAFEVAMRLGGGERVDDIDRGGKEHRVAAQTGGVPESDAEVTFTQADVGDEDDVGVVLNKAQAEEILDLGPVDLLRPAPIEFSIDPCAAGCKASAPTARSTSLIAKLPLGVDTHHASRASRDKVHTYKAISGDKHETPMDHLWLDV